MAWEHVFLYYVIIDVPMIKTLGAVFFCLEAFIFFPADIF